MLDRWSGPYHVVETSTRKSIESHATQRAAMHACEVLNEHEKNNGRSTRYHVEHRPTR